MRGQNIDLATVIGLFGAFGLLIGAMAFGGTPFAFMDGPAMLIVVGGTFAITLICYSTHDVLRAQSVMAKAVFHRLPEPTAAAISMVDLSEAARRDGLLSLQPIVDEMPHSPFLQKALSLVIDGTALDDVERIMRRELNAMTLRHEKSAGVFRKAAEVSPAMGLIGTLVGLVQMLGNLEDPSTIGPAMAIALLTTFYGAILANMVFAPLASKLERNSDEEALVQNLYLLGAVSIGRRENPRHLEAMLNSLLPPSARLQQFD